MNLKAIVVDDEPLAVRRLQIALGRIGGVELLGTASDGMGALELINSASPDLILLDIKMPIMDGFDFLKALASSPVVPEVIFVTAYSDFAVRAFEEGAVGYVLKPIGHDQLRLAIERARVKLRTSHAEERLAALSALLDTLQRREPPPEVSFEQDLWVDSGTGMERVAIADVDWFEAAGDYVAIHRGQKEHLLHDSLRLLIQRLDPDEFARVHRTAIVRLKSIRALERGKFGALILCLGSGDRVPVSRTYKEALLSRIRPKRAAGTSEKAPFGDENWSVGENP